MRYAIHPEAKNDLEQASQFYLKEGGVELQEEFLDEYEEGVGVLLRFPHAGRLWQGGQRSYVLNKFPYTLIYRLEGELLRVVAVSHQSRRPGYWRGRE